MSGEENQLEQFCKKIADLHEDKNAMLRILRIGRKKGFCNIKYRKIFWPLIIELNVENLKDSSIFNEWVKEDIQCNNYEKVKKDVLTAFSARPYAVIQSRYLSKKRGDLLQIINSYICANQVIYFQGLKDISSVLLTIFGRNLGYFMTDKLANIFLKDFSNQNSENLLIVLDKIIFQLVTTYDQEYEKLFQKFTDRRFKFTIPWITTWLSNCFDQMDAVMRIWDYLICSTPEKIIYLCAAVILSSKEELINSLNSNLIESNKQQQLESVCKFYNNLHEIIGSQKIDSIIKKSIELEKNFLELKKLNNWQKLDPRSHMIQENYLKNFPIHEYFRLKQYDARSKAEALNKYLKIGGGCLLIAAIAIGVTKKNQIIEYLKSSLRFIQ